MANKPTAPDSEQDTQARLIQAAKQVFSVKGFSGATVKEIADLAGVNISLISYHFNGKEGLLRACVEPFGRERLQEAVSFLNGADSVEDLKAKLRLWMLQFLRCHVDEPGICTILHRENLAENPFLKEIFESTFLKGFEAVAKFFEHARKKGIVRKDVNPILAAAMLYGGLLNMGKNLELQQQLLGTSIVNEKYRQEVAEQFANMLLKGITGEGK